MSRSIRCLLLVAAWGLIGCAAARSVEPGVSEDRTGGIRLEMLVKTPDNALSHYRIETTGTIKYGGGLDVIQGSFSWSDAMTDEEIETLRSLLDAYQWFSRTPAASGEPEKLRRTVSVAGPPGRNQFEVIGECAEVSEVQELLEKITSRRLDTVLDALPQPGLQP